MPTLDAEAAIAKELTTMERIEHLLTVVACALTRQPAHVVCPWRAEGLNQFLKAVGRG
jgi:hypothetical protein